MIPPWNEGLWRRLTEDRERATHAWLFCGVPGLGKKTTALHYAEELTGGERGFSAGAHPDFHVLSPECDLDPEGTLLQRYGMRYYLTEPGRTAKRVVSIDQVRALTRAISSFGHGAVKVVLVTPAHRMNLSAANALLKSLEEPPSGTVFLLVSERPELLPATVRSRCARVEFRIPPRADALSWLAARVSDPRADLALDVARGAPMLAERYLRSGFLEARAVVIEDIQGVVGGADVSAVPGNWKDVAMGDALGILHGVMSDLLKTRFAASPPGLVNTDIVDWLKRASKNINLEQVFSLAGRIGTHLRDQNSPLDKNLLLEDLLLDLRKASTTDG